MQKYNNSGVRSQESEESRQYAAGRKRKAISKFNFLIQNLKSKIENQKSKIPWLFTACCLLFSLPCFAEDNAVTNSSQPITINSNKMEARKKENLIIFKGDVIAQQKDYTLYAKELRVYYEDGQDIKEMIATGDVKIVQLNRVAKGEKGVYTRETRTVVLTGNPEVEQDCDVVKGDKITIFLNENKTLVDGSVRAVVHPKGDKTAEKCKQ